MQTTMELELRIGAQAACSDGPAGKVRQVVLDRASETVTHLVIYTTPHLGFAVLVPRSAVLSADHDQVQLRCTQAELHRMEPFEDTVFLPPYGPHQTLGYGPTDYFYGGTGSMTVGMGQMGLGLGPMGMGAVGWQGTPPFVVEEHLPPGGAGIGHDAVIEALDGDLGRVDEVLTDPVTGVLTHLVIRRGHLFGAHMLVVPANAIIDVSDERVRLRFTRAEFEAAVRPSVHPPAAGATVVAVFATRQQAEEALAALQADGFPAAALSAVAPMGQALRFPNGSPERQATETRHIAIGGAVGDTRDVALFGHLLVLASLTTGGLAGVLASLGASAAHAQELSGRVRSGQFLVAVHTSNDEVGARAVFGRVGAGEVDCLRP